MAISIGRIRTWRQKSSIHQALVAMYVPSTNSRPTIPSASTSTAPTSVESIDEADAPVIEFTNVDALFAAIYSISGDFLTVTG